MTKLAIRNTHSVLHFIRKGMMVHCDRSTVGYFIIKGQIKNPYITLLSALDDDEARANNAKILWRRAIQCIKSAIICSECQNGVSTLLKIQVCNSHI